MKIGDEFELEKIKDHKKINMDCNVFDEEQTQAQAYTRFDNDENPD